MRGTWQTTSGGSGGLVLVLIAAVVLIGSGAASAAASALASLLVTIAVVLGGVIALAVAVGVGVLVYRARSDRLGRPISAPAAYQPPPQIRERLTDLGRAGIGTAGADLRAIEPPRNELHLHFHGTSPAEAAEAIRQAGKRN